MGEVYRARDAKLGREVAIKVLPEEFTQHPQKLARFEREAKLLAALNHPGIATLYGVEEFQTKPFLVMELVEGQTLAERIARGAIPMEEALQISIQIAEALEAAHEKGVIHRDLKPANIKVDPEGKVKVLDFGLAKAFADEMPESELSQSPTLSRDATRAGVILGTAAYMSPEQAKGKTVDKRTDIFSFGIVLYEMLTGKRAFAGEDVSDVLAAIIKTEPDWESLPKGLGPRIHNVLRRCLAKDRKKRVRDIGDARLEMEETMAEPVGASRVTAGEAPTAWPAKLAWGLVGIVLGAVVAALIMQPSPETRSAMRFTLNLPEGLRLSGAGRRAVAISPDGRKLAYTADNRIYVRDMARLEAEVLTGTDGGRDLAFSPDGQWIAFWTDQGGLKKVAVSGGAPLALCSSGITYGVSWDTEDTIYYGQGPDGIFRVSADGGDPELVVEAELGEEAGFPQLLPTQNDLLFTLRGGAAGEGLVVAESLSSGERRVIVRGARDARYLPTGHLVSAVEADLQVVSFDVDRLEVRGVPATLVEGVLASPAGTAGAIYTVSEAGSLAYVQDVQSDTQLFWVDRQGGRTSLDVPSGSYRSAQLSPDGTRVALQRDQDIWIYDVQRSTVDRLTATADTSSTLVWTPDGKKIVFTSGRDGGHRIFWKNADGTGEAEPLTSGEHDDHPYAVSPDGSVLAFSRLTSDTAQDIWVLPLEGDGEPGVFLGTEFPEWANSFSPDGRWLAFTSGQSGQLEVYVTPHPGPGPRVLISTNGGQAALWSRNGREIFYQEGNDFMAVDVTPGAQPVFGTPHALFEASLIPTGNYFAPFMYSSTPDGRGFFIAESTGAERSTIQIVLNWFSEIERLVPSE